MPILIAYASTGGLPNWDALPTGLPFTFSLSILKMRLDSLQTKAKKRVKTARLRARINDLLTRVSAHSLASSISISSLSGLMPNSKSLVRAQANTSVHLTRTELT